MWLKSALLPMVPALHAQSVEGAFSNSVTHAPVAGAPVTIKGPATYTAITDAAGKFRFSQAQAGEYTAGVRKDGFTPLEPCLKPFRVAEADVRRDCEMEPLARLQGRVLYPDGRPVARATVWIVLYPMGGVIGQTADEQGRFVVSIGAGAYLLRASAPRDAPPPEGEVWAALGQEVELADGMPPFRVVYRPDAPRVRGVVDNGEGMVVALIPENARLMNDQFIRTATASRGGRFEIGSLRPGDDYAFAFDRVDDRMLRDPLFVSGLAPQAVRVHVGKGESASVDLKITPWPE